MHARTLLRWFLNPWVLIGAVLIALILLGTTLGLAWLTRSSSAPQSLGTAVLNIVLAPTSTPTPVPPTPTRAVTPTNTVNAPPPPPEGAIQVGGYVQISSTGGDGLRLRVEPGLGGEVRVLGAESEVFEVNDGPQQEDGFTWWYLVGPYDATRRGWAVANYLTVVQQP